MDNKVTFSTSELNETDLFLINVLLTQANHDKKAVLRAINFVKEKLESDE